MRRVHNLLRLPVVIAAALALGACHRLSTGPSFQSPEEDFERYREVQASRILVASESPNRLPEPKLELTPEVRRELLRLTARRGGTLPASFERGEPYQRLLTEIFEDEGVPAVMINLVHVESGFNANARSHMGAVGMWQFMKGTARNYGLNVGFFRDDRKDPVLSTIAAARHLRDLYLIYKDWYLALAAYNAGPGSVDRAMARSGSRDFWTLARKGKLHRETRDYVPRFIAYAMIAQDPTAHLQVASSREVQQDVTIRARAKSPAKKSPAYVKSRAGNGRAPVSDRSAAGARGRVYTP